MDAIFSPLNPYAIHYIMKGFGIMTKLILPKENILIEIGMLKHGSSSSSNAK